MGILRRSLVLSACVMLVSASMTVAACAAGGSGATSQGSAESAVSTPGRYDPYVSDEACLSCHGGSYEAVAELTADYGDSNPHDSVHGGYLSCNVCHSKGSEVTQNECMTCHDWPRDMQSTLS